MNIEWSLTGLQREELRTAFINSISKSAVGALASHSNDNKECVVSGETLAGIYNVCLFVTFPDEETRWVVRIPITPMVVDGWTKIHPATHDDTSSQTHAYGNVESLTEDKHTTQPFLIMGEVLGKRLDLDALSSSATDIQDPFYDEFVGILVHSLGLVPFILMTQMRNKQSLAPSLYLIENDMQVDTEVHREAAPAFTTTTEVVRYLHGVLEDFNDIPTFSAIGSSAYADVFLPDHADLRREKILVDDDFHIRGIIDWEWVTILPRQLCVPPLWICGLDSDLKDDTDDTSLRYVTRDKTFEAFQRATSANDRYKEYDICLKLWKEERFGLPISFILRSQFFLYDLYYRHIYPAMYKKTFTTMKPTLFESENMPRRLKHREETEQRYIDYLIQAGLHVVTEEDLRKRSRLERLDKFSEDINAYWEGNYGMSLENNGS
ncbi:hypothetical protein E4U53_001390 [Claviceps sorghi]|nr:hypothetical protein E4U53_001390 [Claviceps sorghi]